MSLIDKELNNELKILKDKLYLLNSSLKITPKQKGKTTIAYGTESSHSPTLEMQSLRNSFELSESWVERTAVIDYFFKDTKQSL